MAPINEPEDKNKSSWSPPQLDFRVENLGHPGVKLFFDRIPDHSPYDAMKRAVQASWKWLYQVHGWDKLVSSGDEKIEQVESIPLGIRRVKRITLTIRPMAGVAHTFGNDEGTEKEVHLSLDHIVNSHTGDTVEKKNRRVQEEILGVLVHEVVHCYQYDAKGTAPGGLIEGIADCVRLHESLSPPHWKRVAPKGKHVPDPERPNNPPQWVWDWNWDAGYERTAYFLDWIDTAMQKTTPSTAATTNLTSASRSAPKPTATAIPAHAATSTSAPSAPKGEGLFFRALNSRLENSEWDAAVDLFLDITNWPRESLWEEYCASNTSK